MKFVVLFFLLYNTNSYGCVLEEYQLELGTLTQNCDGKVYINNTPMYKFLQKIKNNHRAVMEAKSVGRFLEIDYQREVEWQKWRENGYIKI